MYFISGRLLATIGVHLLLSAEPRWSEPRWVLVKVLIMKILIMRIILIMTILIMKSIIMTIFIIQPLVPIQLFKTSAFLKFVQGSAVRNTGSP